MTEATEATQEQAQLVIASGTTEEGVEFKSVSVNEKNIFNVSASFTDEQIKEVYGLCNYFFNDGRKLGISDIQEDFRSLIGLKIKEDAPAE